MRSAIFLLVFAAFAPMLIGCSGGGSEDTIKVGVAGPMTGPQARNGEELWLGALLAAEEWNARGGVLGKQIELVQKDDQAEPKEAKKVANELIFADVAAVIGHYNSGVTFPASKEYGKRKIVMLTPAATNPVITDGAFDDGFKTIFRVCGRDDVQGQTGADFVANELKFTRVAIFHDKSIYGEGLARSFRDALKKLGVTITIYEGFDDKERNFRPFLPKLRDGDPQLWYFGGIHSQGGALARQAKESGITIPFMSGDGVFHPEFLAKAGDKAEGAYFTFPDTDSLPQAKEFIRRYEDRFEKQKGPYSVYSYVTANILFESIAKAGSTDGPAIAKAIRGMEHDTVIGPISFNERGDVTRSIYTTWVVKDGKFTLTSEAR
jgi:branched-chain amino acid transport system substrate-binding protein